MSWKSEAVIERSDAQELARAARYVDVLDVFTALADPTAWPNPKNHASVALIATLARHFGFVRSGQAPLTMCSTTSKLIRSAPWATGLRGASPSAGSLPSAWPLA